MAEKFYKFQEGPFRGLVFKIIFDNAEKYERDLEFGQFKHKLCLSYQLYEEWKPVEC
jgi:hypothetical protein